METRTANEARLAPWPKELTIENVASWIWTHAVTPADSWPILHAMQEQRF